MLAFADLDATTAYDVWRLRQQVFVVEQGSPYPDLDGRDREPTTRHLLLRATATLSWATPECSTTAAGRGSAASWWRSTPAVRASRAAWCARPSTSIGDQEIRLDAQTGLRDWYASYGFEVTGPEFDDDGVMHLPMARPAE